MHWNDPRSHAIAPVHLHVGHRPCSTTSGWLTAYPRPIRICRWLSSREELREDTAIGVLFTGMFALGLVMISRARSYQDFNAMLFGDVLGVTNGDLALMAIIAAIVLLLIVLFYKELELSSVDPSYAAVIGLRTNWMRHLLLMLLALAVVSGIQAVGVILTSALLITPAAAASLVTRNLRGMMVVASVIAIASGLIGLYASFYATTLPLALQSCWLAPGGFLLRSP